jgi:predicted ribonuclease toxin of YeeF-YezG toxin-antitoxin module
MMGWDVSIEEAENIADWTNQSFSNINDTGLASITAASDNLSNLGSEFNGATADAVKGYWSEVHGRMVAALSAAIQQLAVSYSEYFNELDSVDGSYCAHFVQDEIQSASNSASNMEADFDGTSQRVSSTLGDVSDIISIDPPSSSDVTACLSDISDFTSGLEQQVSQVESHGVDKANAVDDLISEADAFLQQVELNSARGGMSYVPADFLTTPAATALDDRLVEFNKR